MELFVTDFNRSKRVIIDNYSSFTLETRYNELGTFELNISKDLLKHFDDRAIVECNEDLDFQSYVSYVEANTENENGNVTIKGISLNYILSERVYAKEYSYSNVSLYSMLNSILSNTANSSTSGRNLNIIVEYSSVLLRNKIVSYSGQFENLHQILTNLCVKYDIGFNLKLNESNELKLYIYNGEDLSNDIVFSRDRNTALNSLYIRSSMKDKNFFYIKGENNIIVTLDKSNMVGLSRKEYLLDFSSVSQTVNGSKMSEEQYRNLLLSMAEREFENYSLIESLDTEPNFRKFKYGNDYKMGDIITSDESDFNIRVTKRVTGATQIWSEEGYYLSIILGSQKGLLRY